ncbi:hypothetical protein JTE90_020361 [Oedothorax gibbosus]|uniref:Serpin domain-containing protein n=1 Tax=Oedothorax gibbosus TaxID=931172 RepID=A0AAV6TYY8_9ARAC|nr:hypothetical protein JTE90_020361 [Oedothorax gibbosus]
MMHKEFRFGYYEGGSYTVLQLPYVGRQVAMMVLLPRSLEGIDELEHELTPELFQDLTRQVNPRKVKVALPKFKFEYTKSMKETLKSLGLSKVFDGGAEFGGMSDSNLCVSNVVHKAVVEVNEEGSEAAAATAVMIAKRCMKMLETPNFVVNHPFLFSIYDTESSAVLFLGRINEL